MAMSSRSSSYLAPKECEHLTNYKLKHGANGYDLIRDFIKISPCGKIVVDRSKLEVPSCSFCSNNQGRLYLCLICSSISCSDFAESNHAQMHCQSYSGHDVAVQLDTTELYCVVCSDQVYDVEFDEAVLGLLRRNGNDIARLSKRKRLNFGVDLDLKSMKRLVSLRDQYSKSCFPLGLRGLNNLGSTCFMNSVLQALLHAPPLRNYFLSDRHDREMCRKTSSDRLCLPCDIDAIFSAVFSGDRTPYSPAQFLYSWWQQSENLANYEQQDAHEFFISMLDRFHETEAKASHAIGDNRDCTCIIHKAFAGLLRSDLTCTSCGSTSSTYDPCVDISLDLDTSTSRLRDFGKPSKQNENIGVSTLVGCLDLFTRPEKLGCYQKLYCENCQEKQDTLKQMSIKRLPLVLCLHIKRFEHSPVKRLSRKIDRHLQFPFSLDMKPYLSSSIVRKRLGNRMVALEDDELESNTEFEVFAVVTHSGMLESGHYVTYLRLMNQWFKCDDAWITKVSEEVVRASQCYLIYYVQKMLLHKESEDVSCQPISPRADAFVPIAGCC